MWAISINIAVLLIKIGNFDLFINPLKIIINHYMVTQITNLM